MDSEGLLDTKHWHAALTAPLDHNERDTTVLSFCCGTLQFNKPTPWQVSEIGDLDKHLDTWLFFFWNLLQTCEICFHPKWLQWDMNLGCQL